MRARSSHEEFRATSYGVKSTSKVEFAYVHDPEAGLRILSGELQELGCDGWCAPVPASFATPPPP